MMTSASDHPDTHSDDARSADAHTADAHTRTVLIAGCGDLGTEVGLRFSALGYPVVGLRRSAHLLPPEIDGQSVDLSLQKPEIPPTTDTVVVALAASAPTEEAYRAAYVDGLRNLLDALDDAAIVPRRFVLVSSTAVFDVTDGSWVDETTPALPTAPRDAILLEAEQLLASRVPSAVVLRLSGIYGPGRERLITQVREGRATFGPAPRHTNRIHRDDAAAAIVHLATMRAEPQSLYLGVDDDTATLEEVLTFLAGELSAEPPTRADAGSDRGGNKRLRNTRLKSTGFDFTYPDYRSGYRALLAGEGKRHP
jgi:nucleoside-diphosphate-sugar epimerase